MTLDEALQLGLLTSHRVWPADPLYRCRTASAISPCGNSLYTVIETPIGGRSCLVYDSINRQHYEPDPIPDDLDWKPGTGNIQWFRLHHKL